MKDASRVQVGEGRARRWGVEAFSSLSLLSAWASSCTSSPTWAFIPMIPSNQKAFPSLHHESSSFRSQPNGLFFLEVFPDPLVCVKSCCMLPWNPTLLPHTTHHIELQFSVFLSALMRVPTREGILPHSC